MVLCGSAVSKQTMGTPAALIARNGCASFFGVGVLVFIGCWVLVLVLPGLTFVGQSFDPEHGAGERGAEQWQELNGLLVVSGVGVDHTQGDVWCFSSSRSAR